MTNLNKEELTIIWAEARTYFEEALPEVTRLMQERFVQVHDNPEPESALEQNGLSNGAAVISEHMANNELGVALEHLCYMVEEGDLSISAKTYNLIQAAEQTMQMNILALRRIKPPAK